MMALTSVWCGKGSSMTRWVSNFLLLNHLTSRNCWLIGSVNLRCSSAVGMDADVGFLAVADKAGQSLNMIFSD